jgi:type IV pilus assembly protein PilW
MHTPAHPLARARGFTLVEVMVGLVLAMLTIVIVSQVLIRAEGQKRAATSGSDAQVNGTLALFALQREVQNAGYGLAVNPSALGCTVNYRYKAAGASAATAGSFTLAPVVITQGASGAPDSLRVLRSDSPGAAVPAILTAAHAQTAGVFIVKSSFSMTAGDLVAAVPSTWGSSAPCTLFQVATDSSFSLTDTNVPHAAATTGWNTESAVFPSGGYASGTTLVNLGRMVNRTYGITGNNLVYTELSGGSGSESGASADGTSPARVVFAQIVNLQALYGLDNDGNGVVDQYTDTTPSDFMTWSRVLNVRVVLVARSSNREKDTVTAAAPEWNLGQNETLVLSTANPKTNPGSPTLEGKCRNGATADRCYALRVNFATPSTDTEWQHYRYRVFDTVIPLRNVLWNS